MAIPPGFAQVTMIHSHPAAEGEVDVVYGIEISGGASELMLEQILDAWSADIMPRLSQSVVLEAGRMYVGQDGGDALVFEANAEPPTPGGDASTWLAINTAYLIKKNTGLGGRRNRGRMYLPGVPAGTLNDSGNLNPTAMTNLNNAVNNFLVSLKAVTGVEEMVILHAAPSVLAPTVVSSLTPAPKIATQRRRLRD